jgi:hypothetical protein
MAMTEAVSIPRRAVLGSAAAAALTVTIGAGADGPAEKKVEAKAEDVGSIEAILSAVYNVISGPKGQPRDWDRMRSLFVPGARLIPCLPKGEDGRVAIRVMSVEDYISRSGPILEGRGFVERQIACRIDRFGHMAQVFSTYETRLDGKEAIAGRGINGFHLLWDEKRWWVVTIMWDAESPAQPIPAAYDAKR